MFSLEDELQSLRADGAVSEAAAVPLLARERREIVSIYGELRFLTWGGVMLIATGVGIIINNNMDRIGPLVVAVAIGAAAAACYAWAAWKRSRAESLVDDYVLLLASLLLSSDVAFIEAKFHLLGGEWQRHFLFLAIVHACVAYRFNSRLVLSLALAAIAGWMGLERRADVIFDSTVDLSLRALACAGVVFVWRLADGALRRDRSFGPVFEHFAANLALAGALGLSFHHDWRWIGCLLAIGLAILVARHGLRGGGESFVLYAWIYGVIALDVLFAVAVREEAAVFFFIVVSTFAAIAGLFVIHFRLKEKR